MIPESTTTFTILRRRSNIPDGMVDPYEPEDTTTAQITVASGVRAHISRPSGAERYRGGSQEVVQLPFVCDLADVSNLDQVRDETTGKVYDVTWAEGRQPGFGLDHVTGTLRAVSGLVSSERASG